MPLWMADSFPIQSPGQGPSFAFSQLDNLYWQTGYHGGNVVTQWNNGVAPTLTGQQLLYQVSLIAPSWTGWITNQVINGVNYDRVWAEYRTLPSGRYVLTYYTAPPNENGQYLGYESDVPEDQKLGRALDAMDQAYAPTKPAPPNEQDEQKPTSAEEEEERRKMMLQLESMQEDTAEAAAVASSKEMLAQEAAVARAKAVKKLEEENAKHGRFSGEASAARQDVRKANTALKAAIQSAHAAEMKLAEQMEKWPPFLRDIPEALMSGDVAKLAEIYGAGGMGMLHGFFIDGAMGALQDLYDTAKMATQIASFLATYQSRAAWEGFWMAVDPAYRREQFEAMRERREYIARVARGGQEYLDTAGRIIGHLSMLTPDEMMQLYVGDLTTLEGKLPDDILIAAARTRKLMAELGEELWMTGGKEANYLVNRVFGMILFEVALEMGTAGTAAAAQTGHLSNLIRKLTKLPGLDSPRVRRLLHRFADEIGFLANAQLCFVAGTPVLIPDGTLPIERIQLGMLVLARDEADPQGPVVARRVLETFVTHPTQLRHLTVRTVDGTPETLSGTPNHPFYSIRHGGFVEAGELQIGDELSLADSRTAHVTAIRDESALPGQTFTTYNFAVEEHHTYFVGRTGIWVHNTGNPCDALTAKFFDLADLPENKGKTKRELFDLLKQQDNSDILTPDFDADQLARHWDDVENRLFDPKNSSNLRKDNLGKLIKVANPDPAADALAKRIGGESRVKFANGPDNEFDAVSNLYVAQTKPANFGTSKKFRDQAKATFETAIKTGRIPYFHFDGPPHRDVLRKLNEYAKRYGIDPVIDVSPLN